MITTNRHGMAAVDGGVEADAQSLAICVGLSQFGRSWRAGQAGRLVRPSVLDVLQVLSVLGLSLHDVQVGNHIPPTVAMACLAAISPFRRRRASMEVMEEQSWWGPRRHQLGWQLRG